MSKPRWRPVLSLALEGEHHIVWRDEVLCVQREVVTRYLPGMRWGRPREFYYIDGCKRTFRTEADMLAAIERREECPRRRMNLSTNTACYVGRK